MANEERTDRPALPPYVPYRTFTNFLDSLRVGLPSHIDKSVMNTLSGGMQYWLMSTLRSMKLIEDDGRPTPILQKLAAADGEQRKVLLKELFDTTYRFITDRADLQATIPQKLEGFFSEAGAKGETVEKCVAFFKAFAKDAGVQLSPYVTTRAPRRARRSVPQSPRRMVEDPSLDNGDEESDRSIVEKTPEQVLLDILSPETMTPEELQAVWTLVLYLKKQPQS